MKAIETEYRGALFRSRLEARWAAMFDLLNWSWVYEPFDGDYYIPDFLIEGKEPFLVEVRPCTSEQEYERQLPTIKVPKEVFKGDLLVLGASATPYFNSSNFGGGNPSAGVLWQRSIEDWEKYTKYHADGCVFPDSPWLGNLSEGNVGTACWFRCLMCNAISVHHDWASYHGYSCGCYDGGHNFGSIPIAMLKNYWNQAGTQVRWKA